MKNDKEYRFIDGALRKSPRAVKTEGGSEDLHTAQNVEEGLCLAWKRKSL